MPTRDMTQAQYREALRRYGFELIGFMGYYRLPAPCHNTSVSAWNANSERRRDKLAYLLREWDKAKKEKK